MDRKNCWLLLLMLTLVSTGCGGLSQEDMRAYARPSDDEEEVVAPAAAPAVETPPAADETVTPADANPAKTGASPDPAPAAGTASPSANASTPSVSGGDFDAVAPDGLNTSTANAPAGTGGNGGPNAGPAAKPEDVLGPMPVLSSDPSTEETEALRLWFLKRQQLEQQAENAAAQAAAQAAIAANATATQPGGNANSLAAAGNSPEFERQLLQALFDRLTNPENLAPEEFSRVAQELARAGQTKAALEFHHGWLLTTENSEKLKNEFGWSAALQRPLAAIHWGFAVEYDGPAQLLSKPSPINGNSRAFENPRRSHSSVKIRTYVGELGDRMLYVLDSKIDAGSLGKLLLPPTDNQNPAPTVNLQWQLKPIGFNPESLGRGITLLGGGTRKEVIHFARLEEIDVLIVFEINVKQPRSGPVVNNTTVKLWDVARNRELKSTAALNNIKVWTARQDRSQKDPVERVFEDLSTYIEESLKLTSLPKNLQTEHARARIESLAASQPNNPLATMAEMRYYLAQGLIGDAVLYDGYKVLIGDEPAKKLVAGSAAERVGAISRFLPKVEPVKQ